MKRFLFNLIEENGVQVSISLEAMSGAIKIISEIGEEPNSTLVPIPPMTAEQSRLTAIALIEIALEADGQIAQEICDH